MADVISESDGEQAAAVRRRYLTRFEEDMLRPRPLWIRLIVEFLGTFILVTVAAGAGVINHYAGGNPISRTAAVIAPGAVVMAMIYALGPLSGLHINPAVTFAFASRGVFPAGWVVPYWVVQVAGAPEHRPQCRDRGWLDRRAAGPVREPDQRRVDEPRRARLGPTLWATTIRGGGCTSPAR